MNDKKVAKGSLYIFISQIITLFTKVFLILFLARVLGPSKYGRYSVVLAFCTIAQIFFGAGLTGSITKAVASSKEKIYSLTKFGFNSQLIWSMFIFSIVFLGADFWSTHIFNDGSLALYIRIGALYFIPFALVAMGQAILAGQREFGRIALSVSFLSVLKFFIVLIFLFIWKSVSAVFYAIFIASLIGLGYIKFILPKIEKRKTIINRRQIIVFASSLIISTIAIKAIFQVDKIFIKNILQKDDVVGIYSLASHFSLLLQTITISLIATLFPSMTASFARKDLDLTRKYLWQGTRYLLLILVPLSFGLSIVGKDIILFIFGNRYLEAIPPLAILIFGSVIFSFFLLYCLLLASLDKYWMSALITFSMLTLALVLNPLFIREYGFVGAAWATFTCSTGGALFSGFYIFKLLKLKYPWLSFLRILIASIACFYCAILASKFGYAIRYSIYMILVILFAGFLYFLNELTKEDLRILRKSMNLPTYSD